MNTFRLRWCALRQADKIRFQILVSVCGLSLLTPARKSPEELKRKL
jgi:hypothetical protein